MVKLTLPIDSEERKGVPLRGGCYNYFPAALAGVAQWSKRGNDKHNPGQPLHHARGKSMDHEECIERHGGDLADILAAIDRASNPQEVRELINAALDEYDARSWRSLAASQEFREAWGLAPLAPGARLPSQPTLAPGARLPSQPTLAPVETAEAKRRQETTASDMLDAYFSDPDYPLTTTGSNPEAEKVARSILKDVQVKLAPPELAPVSGPAVCRCYFCTNAQRESCWGTLNAPAVGVEYP